MKLSSIFGQKFLLFLVVFLATFGCSPTPHSDAPKIRFVGAEIDNTGIHVFSSSFAVELEIVQDEPEGRLVFVEILTDADYEVGRKNGLIPGDDWGGIRVSGKGDSTGLTRFEVSDFPSRTEGNEKYWIRSGVHLGESGFGLLVSLVEIPIDKRSGYLFDTISENGLVKRVRYGVSDFVPFELSW